MQPLSRFGRSFAPNRSQHDQVGAYYCGCQVHILFTRSLLGGVCADDLQVGTAPDRCFSDDRQVSSNRTDPATLHRVGARGPEHGIVRMFSEKRTHDQENTRMEVLSPTTRARDAWIQVDGPTCGPIAQNSLSVMNIAQEQLYCRYVQQRFRKAGYMRGAKKRAHLRASPPSVIPTG